MNIENNILELKITTIIFQVIIFSAARFIEAVRDGEAFRDPTADRNLLWHLLKFPQFGLLFALGYITVPFTKLSITGMILSIVFGYIVFEVSLKHFRKKR